MMTNTPKRANLILAERQGDNMKTVLLKDGTVGQIDDDVSVGDEATVLLHDENGNPMEVDGVVEEILID